MSAIERKYQIDKEAILQKKKGNVYRKLSMYLIKKHTDLKLERIGDIYSMDYTAVSQSCSRFQREISGNK
jgi:putative transposase